MSTPTYTDPEIEQSIPVVTIAGAGGGVLVAIGVLAAIVIIIVCVVRKKDKRNRRRSTTDRHTTSREEAAMVTNISYVATTSTIPTANSEAYEGIEIYSEARQIDDETIPTEENAAYSCTAWRDSHSQATTTLTAQRDELNQDSAAVDPEYEYIV